MKTVEEAAKALSYMSFIAGVKFAQRWIPVEKELPNEGELVLTKGGDDPIDIDICWFKNKKFIMRYANQPSYYSNTYRFREDITESTTHWKPIEYMETDRIQIKIKL